MTGRAGHPGAAGAAGRPSGPTLVAVPIPPFVAELRTHVGTAPLWLPGVTAVVLDHAERVLLVRRSDSGRWALVSGILEPGEDPAVGLAREVTEETGVVVDVLALAYVNVTGLVTYPNGDRARYLDLTFLCRHVSGSAAVGDDEATDVGWFALDAVPMDLAASSRDRLAHALAYRSDPSSGTRFVG
jgi:ADP-ribose pyrophosphatase YjhB (NUDIX family)